MKEESGLPLEGIRVVELATVVAAPTVGRMLCSYGAEVIKVESSRGDEMRGAGLFERVICEDDCNPLFTIQNSGKELTSIDLKTPEGMEAFIKMLSQADVFLTNVRSAALKRLSLDYETIREKFPRLVYAHLSGFGPKGPAASDPGFDSTAFWLRSGPAADWQVPGSFPFVPTYAFGDMSTSSVLLSGILMALIGRERTGKGTLVNTSLFACGIWCNAIGVVSHQKQFGGDRPLDPMRPADPLSQTYLCADGKWIGIYDNDYQRDRSKFAEILGFPELASNPEFATLATLSETDAIVKAVERLNEIFRTKTSDEWREILSKNSISCEVMHTLRDVGTDPQAVENDYLTQVDFGKGVKVMMPCPPIQFSEYKVRPYESAGVLGRDTDKVFTELGYSQEQTEALKAKGILK